MSYGYAAALQTAVYQALQGDAALTALVGTHVYDALPTGTVPPLFVSLGPETAKDASDSCGSGSAHFFIVSVVTDADGFHAAKNAAGAVSDALDGADLSLSRGQLVGLWFQKAKAARGSGGVRKIDLTFRARIEDTAD